MDYKIDYDAEYWDVVGNRKFTCYSEEDARWLCNFLNKEEQQGVEIKKLADDMLDVINGYDWETGDPGAIIASAESTLLKISNLLNNQ